MLENKRETNKYLSPFYLHHSKQKKLGKFRAGVNVAPSEMMFDSRSQRGEASVASILYQPLSWAGHEP